MCVCLKPLILWLYMLLVPRQAFLLSLFLSFLFCFSRNTTDTRLFYCVFGGRSMSNWLLTILEPLSWSDFRDWRLRPPATEERPTEGVWSHRGDGRASGAWERPRWRKTSKNTPMMSAHVWFSTLLIKTTPPLPSIRLRVLPKLLVDDITTRLSCGQLHALFIRRLLSSGGSFLLLLLLTGSQLSATIKVKIITKEIKNEKKNCQHFDAEPEVYS